MTCQDEVGCGHDCCVGCVRTGEFVVDDEKQEKDWIKVLRCSCAGRRVILRCCCARTTVKFMCSCAWDKSEIVVVLWCTDQGLINKLVCLQIATQSLKNIVSCSQAAYSVRRSEAFPATYVPLPKSPILCPCQVFIRMRRSMRRRSRTRRRRRHRRSTRRRSRQLFQSQSCCKNKHKPNQLTQIHLYRETYICVCVCRRMRAIQLVPVEVAASGTLRQCP